MITGVELLSENIQIVVLVAKQWQPLFKDKVRFIGDQSPGPHQNEDEALLTSSLQPYVGVDNQESNQLSDSSYMRGMIAYSEIDFPCFIHMITLRNTC